MAIRWQLFPKSRPPDQVAFDIAASFVAVQGQVETPTNQSTSNQVLAAVRPGLQSYGFEVESRGVSLDVPVLFGLNGRPSKTYRVDAWNRDANAVIEVESGAAMDAHRFHKDLLADVDFFCIAVKNEYRPKRFAAERASQRDFDSALVFLETLYASRMRLPLDAVMLLGY